MNNILSIGIRVGLILLVLTLEWYIQKLYLQSEINHSFLSHWPIYLTLSTILTLIYWKFESKQIKSSILKVVSAIVIFGFSFYESNRILLWINSLTQTDIIQQEYQIKLKGVAWGEIGIEDMKTGEYNEIKASTTEIEGLSENDNIQIQLNVGLFGFKYAPTLVKE